MCAVLQMSVVYTVYTVCTLCADMCAVLQMCVVYTVCTVCADMWAYLRRLVISSILNVPFKEYSGSYPVFKMFHLKSIPALTQCLQCSI